MVDTNTTHQVTEDTEASKNIQAVCKVLPFGIHLATTTEELQRIVGLKQSYCQDDRPGVSAFHDDGLDNQGYVLYATDEKNNVASTARLLLDSKDGFPEEKLLPTSVNDMRKNGKKLAELGRLVILDSKGMMLRRYYKSIYDIAIIDNIDVVLVVMKKRNVSSHKKIMAVQVLSEDMGVSWDEEEAELCLVAWDINATQPKFHKWVNRKSATFKKVEWDHYSPFHLGSLVSVQHEVYQKVASMMSGRVLDLGCGSGRVMGYLQDNPNVDSYTGVDSSKEMIKQASWLKEKLEFNAAELVNSKAEDITGQYDSIFSIQSFYSWPDKKCVLSNACKLLPSGGLFVLVTPNDKFDVEKLSRLVKREMLGHPYYEEFLSVNYAIAAKAEYESIDSLIEQVRGAGFRVKTAHSDFFLGGASYLELTKES